MQSERLNRITIDDGQCGGRPCIRGMRIRVTDVLELLGSGANYEEILEDYPYLEREDIWRRSSMPLAKQITRFCAPREFPCR